MNYLIDFLSSFFAIICFCVLLNAPKSEFLFCGVNAGLVWLIYKLLTQNSISSLVATFLAAFLGSLLARVLSYRRKMPVTIFTVMAIVPLVPGLGIYQTMYKIIDDDSLGALLTGVETIKTAIVIALAILMIFSIPPKLFGAFEKKN